MDDLVARRIAGEPLEHIVGWAQFGELRVVVAAGVFVPRQRTVFLAECAIEASGVAPVVVELCCGSGAVSAVIAAARPRARIYAVDIDAAAVRCARANLPGAEVFVGDLYAPLPVALRGRVDVLVANAPYVPREAVALMPPEARDHEPRVALDGGSDGLDVHRRIAAEAAQWLAPGGRLLIEVSEAQVAGAEALMLGAGLEPDVAHSAELEATVVSGRVGT